MTHRLILSPRAKADIDDIWEYSAVTWSADQADRYLTGIENVLQLICLQPGLARLRKVFRPPFRMHSYRSHAIFFQNDAATVHVVRILHARSDWKSLLSE